MKVIQNFSSNAHYTTIPLTDILIWCTGLYNLKSLGHSLKLYCKESDLDFLKKYNLDTFYDEIDISFLQTYKPKINERNFWSVRKLACIENEFNSSTEPFIYVDTDVIINMPLHCPTDLLVWGLEPAGGVYLPWNEFSVPKDYVLPEWLEKTQDAYNCGVLAFKTKDLFMRYLEEYYKFTLENPCKLVSETQLTEEEKRSVWACTAEQRILKGLTDYLDWEPSAITITPHNHYSDSGIHYYILRQNWRLLRDHKDQLSEEQHQIILFQLNHTIKTCLSWLPEYFRNVFLEASIEFKRLYEGDYIINNYI